MSQWYNIQIWDGVPEAVGAVVVVQTLEEAALFSELAYFHSGNEGLLPATEYFWRVRTWYPPTNTYGETWWGKTHEVPYSSLTSDDYLNAAFPTIVTHTVLKEGMGNTFPYKKISCSFGLRNAQGFYLYMSGPNGYKHTWHHVFQPTASDKFPFDGVYEQEITLSTPGTYPWKVRGYNPRDTDDGTEQWTNGAAIIMPPYEAIVATATLSGAPPTDILAISLTADSAELASTDIYHYHPGTGLYDTYLAQTPVAGAITTVGAGFAVGDSVKFTPTSVTGYIGDPGQWKTL